MADALALMADPQPVPHGKSRKTAVQEELEARERIAEAREQIIRDYRSRARGEKR